VTRNKIHIEDPQILGASEQNQVATETWRPKFCGSRKLGDLATKTSLRFSHSARPARCKARSVCML